MSSLPKNIKTDIANDPCVVSNAPVQGGFAGFSVAVRFIGNVGVNNRSGDMTPIKSHIPVVRLISKPDAIC